VQWSGRISRYSSGLQGREINAQALSGSLERRSVDVDLPSESSVRYAEPTLPNSLDGLQERSLQFGPRPPLARVRRAPGAPANVRERTHEAQDLRLAGGLQTLHAHPELPALVEYGDEHRGASNRAQLVGGHDDV
jgi:hypothetical protein